MASPLWDSWSGLELRKLVEADLRERRERSWRTGEFS